MRAQQKTVALASFLVVFAISAATARTDPAALQTGTTAPVLRNTCLITKDVSNLVEFYSRVLGLPVKKTGDDYAEFHTGGVTLAIFSAEAQEKYIPGAAQAGSNKSAILEFEVADVDREYTRLQGVVKDWVKPPTTQPWGTRSFYFRDPDGNLVDFYTWVKAH